MTLTNNLVADLVNGLGEDERDATYCAAVAYLFDTKASTLELPPTDADRDEGWIWLPRECWRRV